MHLSRGIRWDSDHIVIFNEDIVQIAEEVVKTHSLDRVHLATDYFDASINRIAAYVIGARAVLKAFLYALLEQWRMLREHEQRGQSFQQLALLDDMKAMPFGAVLDYYCVQTNVPPRHAWMVDVEQYEKNILLKRI